MSVPANVFFSHMKDFFHYRSDIYETSDQTLKSNLADINLFKGFITTSGHETINGKAVVDFQYHLKNDRHNCGTSINRKLFSLRSYGNFLKLYDVPEATGLPFYDVLKIRSGYRNRPHALTPGHIRRLFDAVDGNTILGIRDYALYALMYQLGLRVGEVHLLNLADLDWANSTITVMGKGRRPRTLHMNRELTEILSEYLAVRELIYNSWMIQALFVSKKGHRLAIRTMEENLKKIVLLAGLQVPFNVTCHTLRHSLASISTIMTSISWSYRASSATPHREAPNRTSIPHRKESVRHSKDCP